MLIDEPNKEKYNAETGTLKLTNIQRGCIMVRSARQVGV